MSGWGFDTGSLGSFARTAISTATQQIDKVLDIDTAQDPTGGIGGGPPPAKGSAYQPSLGSARGTKADAGRTGGAGASTSSAKGSTNQSSSGSARSSSNTKPKTDSSNNSAAGGSFWDSWDTRFVGNDAGTSNGTENSPAVDAPAAASTSGVTSVGAASPVTRTQLPSSECRAEQQAVLSPADSKSSAAPPATPTGQGKPRAPSKRKSKPLQLGNAPKPSTKKGDSDTSPKSPALSAHGQRNGDTGNAAGPSDDANVSSSSSDLLSAGMAPPLLSSTPLATTQHDGVNGADTIDGRTDARQSQTPADADSFVAETTGSCSTALEHTSVTTPTDDVTSKPDDVTGEPTGGRNGAPERSGVIIPAGDVTVKPDDIIAGKHTASHGAVPEPTGATTSNKVTGKPDDIISGDSNEAQQANDDGWGDFQDDFGDLPGDGNAEEVLGTGTSATDDILSTEVPLEPATVKVQQAPVAEVQVASMAVDNAALASPSTQSDTSSATATHEIVTASLLSEETPLTSSPRTADQPVANDAIEPLDTGAGSVINAESQTSSDAPAASSVAGSHMPLPVAVEPVSDTGDVAQLRAQLAECRKVLDVREAKMVELSRDNIDAQETNAILRSQLQQAEEIHQVKMADVEQSTAEFTERLSAMERRFQQKSKDYDQLRKDHATLATDCTDHDAARGHYQKMLQEKDESIEGLMAEGEKLSKQQLQSSNMIKKLRLKEKELDQQVSTLQRESEQSQKALVKLQGELKQKDETERKFQESLLKVNAVAEKQSKEILTLKSGLQEEEEKARTLQSALDNAYKEIAALQKEKASHESAAHEAALESEVEARRELKQELERTRGDARTEQESLLLQISDLRASLTRAEQLSARREDHLKQEIQDLHTRLQDAEGHSQDLSNTVSSATRPLIRQIENLQSSHSAQTAAWEKLERNLSERLVDAQNQAAEVGEHDRLMSDRVLELQGRLSTIESSLTTNRQDKARLMAELELLRSRHEASEEERTTAMAKLEAVRSTFQTEIDIIRKEKMSLDQQLDAEKSSATAERRRAFVAEERLEKERQRCQKLLTDLKDMKQHSPVTMTPSPAGSTSGHSSGGGAYPNQGEILEESMHGALPFRSLSSSTPDGSFAGQALPVAIGMEKLRSLLKQREGEVTALQSQVSMLEKARASVSEELTTLASENEQLERKIEGIPGMRHQIEELDKRYNTMLQMYGEKAEQANELRMDLEDVKSMYKQQIQDLLSKGM